MIILVGESRFPVVYSPDGHSVLKHTPRGPFGQYLARIRNGVVLHTIGRIQTKVRFVLEKHAVTPDLATTHRVAPVYVYPSTEPEIPFKNIVTRGLVLRGVREPLFVPLLGLREITTDEAGAMQAITFKHVVVPQATVSTLTLERMLAFLSANGIQYTRRDLVNGIVLDLRDPQVTKSHGGDNVQVLLSPNGQVRETNICFDTDEDLYLTEFIMLTRRQRHLHVWSRRW